MSATEMQLQRLRNVYEMLSAKHTALQYELEMKEALEETWQKYMDDNPAVGKGWHEYLMEHGRQANVEYIRKMRMMLNRMEDSLTDEGFVSGII